MKSLISVHKPTIKRKDLEYVLNSMMQDSIDYGEFARNFEKRLSERTGCYDVLAVNSYYSAIDLVLETLEINEGDEVIIPSFLPQVYLNVIAKRKAVPVLVDLETDYFQPSLESIREAVTAKTKLLFLYYYFGYTYDSSPYLELVPNVIEDITSVLGTKSGENRIGSQSTYAIADFSTKGLITTGEGGAVFSPNRKAYHLLMSHVEKNYDIENFYPRLNCLIPDLNAAMGISQDETLNHRLKLLDIIGKIYEESVKRGRNSIVAPKENHEKYYTDFPILVKSSLKDAVAYLKKNGIEGLRPLEYPLHQYLKLAKDKFPVTEHFYLGTLLIPIHSTLKKKDVDLISKVLATMI